MTSISALLPPALALIVACVAPAHSAAQPARATGPVYYLSDCQPGAATGCVEGSNSNSGTTPTSPRKDLRGLDVNNLPAGTQLLFAKGGAWTGFNVVLRNLQVTPERPMVFDSYTPPSGATATPWLKAGGAFYAFQFGTHGDTANDGGYTIRNLKLDGLGASGSWGVHLRYDVRNVTLENLEITGFELGIHSQNTSSGGNVALVIRNSNIHRNTGMGMLGDAIDLVIEGNTFANNNFSGSSYNHAIYLGGHGRNGVVRNNTFTNNSAVNGVCSGGNFTVHGKWDGLLVEGNTITQQAAGGGCYGISINGGYNSGEYFRNLVLRGNTIVNVGGCGICLTSSPGALIERNTIINTQPTYLAAILIPTNPLDGPDDPDGAAVIRRNTIYLTQAAAGSEGIALRTNSGSKVQVSGNLIYFGAASNADHACFSHGDRAQYAAFDGNLCHHAGGKGSWSRAHRSLASAKSAGFDANGSSADPLLTVAPAEGGRWRCQLATKSPALNASDASSDVGNCQRATN